MADGSASDPGVSAARVQAGHEIRRLLHAFVGHDVGDTRLREIADLASELTRELESAPARTKPDGLMSRFNEAVADGGELTCWDECVIAGQAHPYGTGLVGRREGDEAVAWVTLGPAHEGAPGRSHGGIVAALFDETMGFALWMQGIPAYTAWLTTTYSAPTPIGARLEFRARVSRIEGRKVFLDAEAFAEGEVVGRAEALFIAIPADQLAS